MSDVVRSDDRGRVTIPKWAREKLSYKSGEPLELRVENTKIILSPSSDQEERLDSLVKHVRFDRSARRRAEERLKDRNI